MSYQVSQHIDKNKIFIIAKSSAQERLDAQYHKERFDFTGYHRLSEYVSVKGGKRIPKGMDYSSDLNSPYLYLRVADITDEYNINYHSFKRIDKSLYERLSRYEISNGEIALSIAGSIGKVFLLQNIPERHNIVLTENCAKISVKDTKYLLPEYLSILFTLPIVQKQLMLNYVQTTIAKLSLERIGKIMIPPIPDKEKQLSIINTYQLAIERKRLNSQKAQQLLDNIDEYLLTELEITMPKVDKALNSRTFFTSFLKVEGIRIDPIFSLYLGKNVLSSKYENIHLSSIADIFKGNALTSAEIEEGSIPVIAGGQTSPYNHSQSNFDGNVITVSASGAYAGYVWYHDYPIYATDCNVIVSKDESRFMTKYLFEVLKLQQKAIYRLQTGAAQPHVYAADLQMLNIPVVSLEKQREIVDCISNIRNKAKDLQEEGAVILENAKHEVERMIIG